MSTINGITHISLSVRDLDLSADFYRAVFDMQTIVGRFPRTGYDEVILRIPGRGGVALCLQAHHANDYTPFQPERTGLDHLALAVDGLESLREWGERLDRLGVQHSGMTMNDGFGHLIALRDPDGIQLELHTMD